MPLAIDHLTEAELIELNHRIVARLRILHELHAHRAMIQFAVGDHVAFQSHPGETTTGVITRYNRKTVTIKATDGRIWRVSPSLLARVVDSQPVAGLPLLP